MKRILTAAAMAAVMIPILIWGDRWYLFDGLALLLALLAALELRNTSAATRKVPRWTDALALFAAALVFLAVRFADGGVLLAVVIGLVLLFGAVLVFSEPFKSEDFGLALTAAFYPGAGFGAVALLRGEGLGWIVFVLLAAMVADTAGFLVGTRYGKHRLCPTVSPKKSVEGAVAGTVFGTAAAAGFALFTGLFPASFGVVPVLLVAFALAVLAQLGDLVASKIKRSHGVKDFSNLFPGHGGVLDRFDSSLYAAAALVVILLATGVLVR